MNTRFYRGQRVFGPHGRGTIVEIRTGESINLDTHHAVSALGTLASAGIDCTGLFYGPDRYPLCIQFDDGYQDVYAPTEINNYSQYQEPPQFEN